MNSLHPLSTLTKVFIITGMAVLTNEAGVAQGAAGEQLVANNGGKPDTLKQDGNFKEAYDIYHKLLTDPGHGGEHAATDILSALDCLTRLRRLNEWDDFADEVVAAHPKDWQILHAVAKAYRSVPHYGRLVDGKQQHRRTRRRNTQVCRDR